MARVRAFFCTINNYTDDDLSKARYMLSTAEYGIIGFERAPTTNTPHLHAYGYYPNKISFSKLQKWFPRANIQAAMGTAAQNKTYISKDGDFEEFGDFKSQGERSDIENFRDAILEDKSELDLLMEFPLMMAKYDRFYQRCRNIVLKKKAQEMHIPEVTVIVGDTGIGKTHTVYAENNIEDIYKVEVGDGTSGSIWWDNYNGESVILIDDFHSNFKLDYMLRLLDRYPMKLAIKGSYTYKCAKKIYITSNIDVEHWYPNCHERHRKALFRRISKIVNL